MAYRAEPAAHERDRANEATGESVRLSFMTTNENEEKAKALAKRIRDLIAEAKRKEQAEFRTGPIPWNSNATRPARS
jgi:glutamine synthetase